MIFDCRHEQGIAELNLEETKNGDAEIKCSGRYREGSAELSETCKRCKHYKGFRGYKAVMLIRS